jgi:hypothetical protein
MSNPNQEQIIERRRAHFAELDGYIREINRLHVLLAGDKSAKISQRDTLQEVFDELNGWSRTSLKRAKSAMGCG